MNQKKVDRVGVVIATTGRAQIAAETIRSIAKLQSIPECIIVAGAAPEDLPEINEELPFELVAFITSSKGLPIQRNEGIAKLKSSIEFVCFLDDDMELHQDYFSEIKRVFESDKEIAGFSGAVLANGNIDRIDARELMDQHSIHPEMPFFGFYPKKWPGFYGCNMNIRKEILKYEQFDERLPMYALGEDCEMGFRVSQYGKVGGSARCAAVHLASRSGRISEVGVGYAQIINYLYFSHKGIGFPVISTYFNHVIKTPMVNLTFFMMQGLDSRKQIDRKGRFVGNLLALKDLVFGNVEPMNLLKIKKR
jgi:GT2 family glycosyltransferase